ncbi:putative nitroreductase [Gordonia hirsuta DSM 44140 = NBRC 16056]|uniref:Putative nitroreductase n=1 Tax=Gordonia hirsuta DSM 44140 = NBRC 16056 TaxID=1121927 RepID=L7LDL2_9ACTN|nr:putative nitroreductase [Gordonia hirsuta DSM 44140 = NBRC 16056]
MPQTTTTVAVHPLIAGRWSARGYDVSATIDDDELTAILEAGRWAPTWGRIQPVRFLVGRRGDPTFEALTATLNRGNAGWAPAAAAFIALATTDDPDDAAKHEYGAMDAGLALGQMLLQTQALGFNGHPMAGFNRTAVDEVFGVPPGYRSMVILAVGKLAEDPSTLTEAIRERDAWPRERLPLDQIAFAGRWDTPFD